MKTKLKNEYPKFVYHAYKGCTLVSSKNEERAPGYGWCDTPEKALNKKLSILEKVRRFLILILGGRL